MLHAAYLVSLFEDTNLAAIHAKRVTMYVYFFSLSSHIVDAVWSAVNLRILLLPAACVVSALKSDTSVFGYSDSNILCKSYIYMQSICSPLASIIV
jgi:hypothetical protein